MDKNIITFRITECPDSYYEMSMMDAPYFGISKEFINGYLEAIKKIKEDIAKLEN